MELHFTYDEEFGGDLGPGWLLRNGLTKPDLLVAAGFSYQVVVAHNGCLQMEVTVHGEMAHAAIPDSGTDACKGAVHILNALYALNRDYQQAALGRAEGITHPYLNIGRIDGGTNTNVVPGKVVFKLDRRMIPEEDPARLSRHCATPSRRCASFAPAAWWARPAWTCAAFLLAPRHETAARQRRPGGSPAAPRPGRAGRIHPSRGHALYTDVRLYGEHGIPGVIYGAGPRTVRESNAKRADEHLVLRRFAPRHPGDGALPARLAGAASVILLNPKAGPACGH